MGRSIDTLTIKGYKSIRSLEHFALRPLNVLIGANGAGKSNFVSFFSFLRLVADENLQFTVGNDADGLLHLGPKVTQRIEATLEFAPHSYALSLARSARGRFRFESESAHFSGSPA